MSATATAILERFGIALPPVTPLTVVRAVTPRKKTGKWAAKVREAFPLDQREIAALEATRAAFVPRWTTVDRTTYGGPIVSVEIERPAPPAPGSDCEKWRLAIVKGLPLFKAVRATGRASYARVLDPIRTRHRWERTEDGVPGHWVHDVSDRAPLRVRCPSCERPIRLSGWWYHGCEKAICTSGEVFGDFDTLTEGAAAPAYEEA